MCIVKRSRLTVSSTRYESLEMRRLLAGNVTVLENVHLYIRGDAADNQFEIVADGDQLRINGLGDTTINGQETYLVKDSTVTDEGAKFAGGLRAHLGPGHDQLRVNDAVFEAFSIVFGGTGDDDIDVVDSAFMDRFTIQTFDGDDSVYSSGSHFNDTFRVMTLDGKDSISTIDSMMAGNSLFVGGDHADTIHSDNTHYMGNINLVLPLDGNDTVQLTNPVIGENQLGVFLGEGDDVINADLTDATVNGTIRIGGQGGVDEAGDMEMDEDVSNNVIIGAFERGEVFNNAVDVNRSSISYYFGPRDFYLGANRVALDETTRVREVEWTGTYIDNALARDDVFTIAIYDETYYETLYEGDYFGPVGDPLAAFEVGNDFGVDVNRIDTGKTHPGRRAHDPDLQIFSYSAQIDFEFEANKNYWISIYSGISEQDNDYVDSTWQWGFELNETEIQEAAVFVTGQNRQGQWLRQWIGSDAARYDFALRS